MGKKGILDRVSLPTRVVVNRKLLNAKALAGILREGSYAPHGGDTCELEAGGQVLARGKIVKRRGAFYFKALEIARDGSRGGGK